MKTLLKKILLGDTVVTEYSKVVIPGEIRERVCLEMNGRLTDVSDQQWILCIEPLVFGVWLDKDINIFPADSICHLHFTDGEATVAIVTATLFDSIEEADGRLLLLRLQSSRLRHFHSIKTRLLYEKYYNKPGMPFDRFSGFVSAYSYPRRIRLVSFGQQDYCNLFPMDLLGPAGSGNRYVFGLRHTNITLARILDTGNIVVAEVPFGQREAVYQLARHHSSAPPSPGSLPFELLQTKQFGFYIPAWAGSYREIRIVRSMDLGSHCLLWGIPIGETILDPQIQPLHLLHFMEYFHQKAGGRAYPLA
ncbi:MAG: hypothetical protein JST39_04535 [Bacteroidetes bacterium]|nr:hypothetical protein [Bacteroidota bacterium]